jgi:predicted O-methyltransferase YrrM
MARLIGTLGVIEIVRRSNSLGKAENRKVAMYSEIDLSLLPPCGVLEDALRCGRVVLPDGTEKRLTANIGPRASHALYQSVLKQKPKLVVEIGMAQGVSTLTILTALAQVGGQLISIDPYVNWTSGRDAALHNVKRAGFAKLHRHVEDFSFNALPRLTDEGIEPEFAYIDGAHDFANVFIDAFYLDRMLNPGGILAFNDAGWPDVYRVIKLIKRRPFYEPLDVGLAREFRGRSLFHTLARVLLQRSREDRYFRKRENYVDNA